MSLGFKELTLLHRDSIVDITNQEDVMGGSTKDYGIGIGGGSWRNS